MAGEGMQLIEVTTLAGPRPSSGFDRELSGFSAGTSGGYFGPDSPRTPRAPLAFGERTPPKQSPREAPATTRRPPRRESPRDGLRASIIGDATIAGRGALQAAGKFAGASPGSSRRASASARMYNAHDGGEVPERRSIQLFGRRPSKELTNVETLEKCEDLIAITQDATYFSVIAGVQPPVAGTTREAKLMRKAQKSELLRRATIDSAQLPELTGDKRFSITPLPEALRSGDLGAANAAPKDPADPGAVELQTKDAVRRAIGSVEMPGRQTVSLAEHSNRCSPMETPRGDLLGERPRTSGALTGANMMLREAPVRRPGSRVQRRVENSWLPRDVAKAAGAQVTLRTPRGAGDVSIALSEAGMRALRRSTIE
eukprot:TRINITY_DN18623_c0_g1_i1.p1 TRINITY_DN18623_c0_g1~~TRINITY_DN18623_c0_g1_i1.p1  ORF type:complete len:384 (-),score=71.25 TRINITY_DN18623_c0_g1_i1:507-1619(-)